jgi:hypothetical protein
MGRRRREATAGHWRTQLGPVSASAGRDMMRRTRLLFGVPVLFALLAGSMLLTAQPSFAKTAAKPKAKAKRAAPTRAARPTAPVIDPQARQLVQKMSNYLASLPRFTVHTDTTQQVVYPSGLVLDSDRAADVAVERPNHMKAHVMSAKRNVEMYYDGSNVSLYSPDQKLYTTRPAPPTIDQLVTRAQQQEGLALPAADFLFRNPYDRMMAKVQRGSYIGKALIGGVMTDQLAFRQKGVDWQLWIQEGDKPLPVRLAIKDKAAKGNPWYTVTLTQWDTAPQFPPGMFAFTPPEGAQRIAAATLAELRAKRMARK